VPTAFEECHLDGPQFLHEELHVDGRKFSFRISPNSFFQPNTRQAEVLYDLALRLLPEDARVLYDLYCGVGGIGICMAHRLRQVIGVELSPSSIQDLSVNIARNRIENFTFFEGDVPKVVARLKDHCGYIPPDVVVVDPPRAGLGNLRFLKLLSPRYIVYISCNPVTQATDVGALAELGYRLQSLHPVDQFPHTHHAECIGILYRYSNPCNHLNEIPLACGMLS
jgi:23S rRNA (uracil1939-C5)-methyltransferase